MSWRTGGVKRLWRDQVPTVLLRVQQRMYGRLATYMDKVASRGGMSKKERKAARKAGRTVVVTDAAAVTEATVDAVWIPSSWSGRAEATGPWAAVRVPPQQPHPTPLAGGHATQRLVDFLGVFSKVGTPFRSTPPRMMTGLSPRGDGQQWWCGVCVAPHSRLMAPTCVRFVAAVHQLGGRAGRRLPS